MVSIAELRIDLLFFCFLSSCRCTEQAV